MGNCVSSKPQVLPPAASGRAVQSDNSDPPRPPEVATVESGKDSARWSQRSDVSTTSGTAAGAHWAENVSPCKDRRMAASPWKGGWEAPASPSSCQPCGPSGASMADLSGKFEFQCTFPMMVMSMETFLNLDRMRTYEDMIADGLVFEWEPSMGGHIWFLSHQWCSFSHPDPESEQLVCAQKVLTTISNGGLRSIFATEEEWKDFEYKETNRFMNLPVVNPAEMAEQCKSGFVWLDYSSVPQAAEAEEKRLCAIDSIPFYVDHALVFLALVPRVEHKDLPGVTCDYKSWQNRGWCRLETQVQELRLFQNIEGEMMPGVGRIDVPCRPLIVHSPEYATTYDMFDNFYMNWQRKNSVFSGEFACCRLGHKRIGADGVSFNVSCDKDRIRPLVRGLWDRKVYHLRESHPVLQFLFHWRWMSHVEINMTEVAEDTGDADDKHLATLDDIFAKYKLDQTYANTMVAFSGMFRPMFLAHPSLAEGTPPPEHLGITAEQWLASFHSFMEGWDQASEPERLRAIAMMFMVAEGNLQMVQMLHKQHQVPLHLGFFWGITLLDFAAGKGHLRVMRYLLENVGLDSMKYDAGTNILDKPSFRDRITAVDRASKAGFPEAIELLHSFGCCIEPRRLNQQTPAHGAAMWGNVECLRKLHELGADVLSPLDTHGKAPLDYAMYYRHMACEDYLRAIGGAGYLTEHERAAAAAATRKLAASIQIQAGLRGRSARALVRNALTARRQVKPAEINLSQMDVSHLAAAE